MSTQLAAFTLDPSLIMEAAGMQPDPWQVDFLLSEENRVLLNCTRQGGKSTVTAARALHCAWSRENAEVLLIAPTLDQSQELFSKVLGLYSACGQPIGTSELSSLRVRFNNGSRIKALPGSEKSTRGYSGVDLLVIDEAAQVDDALYFSLKPMLIVSGGALVCMSTPHGRRGFFYEEWYSNKDWQRIQITAADCPRINEEDLEEERRSVPRWMYEQEYFCKFHDTDDAVFRSEDIDRAFTDAVKPLFAPAEDVQDAVFEDIEPIEV